MNKRGQFFIIAAIVIIILGLGLIIVYSQKRNTPESHKCEKAKTGFEEINNVIDYSVYRDKNAVPTLKDFIYDVYLETHNVSIFLIYKNKIYTNIKNLTWDGEELVLDNNYQINRDFDYIIICEEKGEKYIYRP